MHSGLQGKSPCCHRGSSAQVRNQVLKYSLQWKKILIIFLISRICQCLWCPEVRRDSPHWRTLSITEVSHQASRTGKMGRDPKCWVKSTKVSHCGCPHRISNWAWLSSLQQRKSHACCPQNSAENTSAAYALSPLGKGLIQTAQRPGSSVSLALMWRASRSGAVTVQKR